MSLPVGFPVALGADVRAHDDWRTLVGADRVVRLSAQAARQLRDGLRVDDDRTALFADRLIELGLVDPVVGQLPALDAEVTYVVPLRDRVPALHRLLDSIPENARIVIIDDASADGASVAAVARELGARLVRLCENVGPAAARNAGLAVVRTPYVAFVDSDVVLPPGAIAQLLRHFHDPRVALVAPRVSGTPGPGWVAGYETVRSSLDLGPDPAAVHPLTRISWLPSACLVARVEALGTGFDTDLRVAEDVDLVWRVVAAGWRARYEPAVRVNHETRSSVARWWGRKAFYGTGADQLARRHGGAVAPAVITPWGAALAMALLAQRSWSLPTAAAAMGIATARLSGQVGTLAPSIAWREAVFGEIRGLPLMHSRQTWQQLGSSRCHECRHGSGRISVDAPGFSPLQPGVHLVESRPGPADLMAAHRLVHGKAGVSVLVSSRHPDTCAERRRQRGARSRP